MSVELSRAAGRLSRSGRASRPPLADCASASRTGGVWRLDPRWPLLALFAFALFGPLANLGAVGVRREVVLPQQAAGTFGTALLGARVPPARRRAGVARDQHLDRVPHRRRGLAVAIPAGYALARLKLPFRALILLVFLLPQAVPNMPIYINIARVFYRSASTARSSASCSCTPRTASSSVWIASAAFAAVDASSRRRRATSARRRWTFFTVTLPLAAPGLMASAIFVFLESLDEFTGTYFVGVPDVTTLPLLMFNASMGGNYQIASITALLLLVPSIGFMLSSSASSRPTC